MKKILLTLFLIVGSIGVSWGQTPAPIYLSGYSTMDVPAVSYLGWEGGTINPNGTYTHKETINEGGGFAITEVYENGDGVQIRSTVYSFGAKSTDLRLPTATGSSVGLWTANNSIDKVLDGTTPWSASSNVAGYSFAGGSTSLTAPVGGSSGGTEGGSETTSSPQVIQTTDGLILQSGEFYPLDRD